MEGKEWRLEKEMADHSVFAAGKQKEMDACSWLTFSFSFSAGPQPMEWWHTQVQRVFPPQLIRHPPNRHAHMCVPKVSIHVDKISHHSVPLSQLAHISVGATGFRAV